MAIEITSWAGMQQLYRHPAVESVRVEKVFNDIKDIRVMTNIIQFALMNISTVKGYASCNIYFPISKTTKFHVHFSNANAVCFRIGLQRKYNGRWDTTEKFKSSMKNRSFDEMTINVKPMLEYLFQFVEAA